MTSIPATAPRVLKFGGTSVANAGMLGRTAAIVARARRDGEIVVVVSALGGITNALLGAARQAAAHDGGWTEALDAIGARHRDAALELKLEGETLLALQRTIAAAQDELGELLHGAYLLREATPRALDRIASWGERLAAPLVAAALGSAGVPAVAVDARELVRTDRRFGNAAVDLETTYGRLRAWHAARGADAPVPVVTGFLGATADGETTTLGRGGSDLTAALVGAALAAPAIEIWTDVSGVLSADPRLVPSAFPLPELSYEELMELSHFGAKVVYPPTVHPARLAGIPLRILNTFDPDHPGTRVTDRDENSGGAEGAVRGLASIPRVALARLEGDGMVGVPGIAARLFGALARHGISIILITQASSEHSISFAIRPEDVAVATDAVDGEFRLERSAGIVDPLVVESDLAIVAVVGGGMRERPGIAGRIFDVLGRHGVNVRAIAQGSSERNISLAVAAGDEARALRVLHVALFERDRPTRIYLAGAGGVGAALLGHLTARDPALEPRLAVAAVARSSRLLVAPPGAALDPASATAESADAGPHPDPFGALVDAVLADPGPRVLVDVTASDATAAAYPRLLAAGCAIVAANKRPFAAPWTDAAPLFAAARGGGGQPRLAFHSTTVGAGLPFLATVRARVAAGDRIRRLEGVFSGTLSFLMGRLAAGVMFSDAVREAHALGYTEPDPRDDLECGDVARKLLILARTAGHPLEPADVAVEPLLPAAVWRPLTLEALWHRLPEIDAQFAGRIAEAAYAGRRVVVLARLEVGESGPRATVGPVAVAPDHPAATLGPGENVCVLWTDVYHETPLAIRGRGAGPVLTAAGVLADVVAAAGELQR